MNRAARRRQLRERRDELVPVELCDCRPMLVMFECGRIAECNLVELDTLPEASAS